MSDATPSIDPLSAAPNAAESVTVRMYRGLLGDCFLLVHTCNGETFKALIDCGVLQCIGTKDSKPKTRQGVSHVLTVAADLAKTLSGGLDLMIATHEHYDHLSGFILGYEALKDIEIKALWLGWTENLNDPKAQELSDRTKKAVSALRRVANNPKLAADPRLSDPVQTIRSLLQFQGGLEDPPAETKRPMSCFAVLEWLKMKAQGQVRYLEPGEVVAFGLDDRLKAYVLGPPRDRKLLKQLDPDPKAPEVYLAQRGETLAIEAALSALEESAALDDAEFPFARRFHTRPEQRTFSTAAAYDRDERRNIDHEWLGSAESLALKIDGDVNNTSLALAIETADKDVLLFPADAQVGNWLSWHNQTYPATWAPGAVPPVTIDDLLSRVVFYKVGHHASHNATLKAKGLALMTSPRLAAMIPVVEDVATEQKTRLNPAGWAMPYAPLYKELMLRTAGRLIRGDGELDAEREAFSARPGGFTLTYADETSRDPLWVSVTMTVRERSARFGAAG